MLKSHKLQERPRMPLFAWPVGSREDKSVLFAAQSYVFYSISIYFMPDFFDLKCFISKNLYLYF